MSPDQKKFPNGMDDDDRSLEEVLRQDWGGDISSSPRPPDMAPRRTDPSSLPGNTEGGVPPGISPPSPWFPVMRQSRPTLLSDLMRMMEEGDWEQGSRWNSTAPRPVPRDGGDSASLLDELPDDAFQSDEARDDAPGRCALDESEHPRVPTVADCIRHAQEALSWVREAYPDLLKKARPLLADRLTQDEWTRGLSTGQQGGNPETAATPEEMIRQRAIVLDARFWNTRTVMEARAALQSTEETQGPDPEVFVYLPVGPTIDPEEDFLSAWWCWAWTHVVEPQPGDVPRAELLAAWRERLVTWEDGASGRERVYDEIERSVWGRETGPEDGDPEVLPENVHPFGYE